eukprot:Skav228099  [mRNA]  locus=scaffold4074:42021:50711:+ [translate_table: standard]
MVRTKARGSPSSITYTQKKLGKIITQKWQNRELNLKDADGVTVSPLPPNAPLTEEDKTFLKSVRGAYEAYEGVRTWSESLKVTSLQGSQVVIQPTALAEFAAAPPSIRESVAKLQKSHEEKFQSLLVGRMADSTNKVNAQEPVADPRPVTDEAASSSPIDDLPSMDEATMKSQFKITCEATAFDSRNVKVFLAEDGHVFIMAVKDWENHVLKPGFKLGSVGSGKVAEMTDAASKGVRLSFPHGDRTLIEIVMGAGSQDDDSTARTKSGSVYSLMKDLSKSCMAPLQMTGYHVEATTGTGSSNETHGYKLTPDGKSWGFEMKDKDITSFTSGNIMKGLAQKLDTVKLMSCLQWQWKFSVDTIHNKLTARKPFLRSRAASALRVQMKQQPEGQRPRRPIARADREKVVQKATVAFQRSAIPEEAYKFLTEWAKGTLRRHHRPQSYSVLTFITLSNDHEPS